MAILKILTYPEKSLLQPSVIVDTADETAFDDDIKKLTDDMGETMFDAPGVGLAAPQAGVNKRIIVYDSNAANPEEDESSQKFTALINPEIVIGEGETNNEEACLSLIDFSAPITRNAQVKVRGVDRHGNPMDIEAEGLKAICLQHEIDHLDGTLIIDYISSLKRALYKKRLKKKLKKT